MWCGNCMDKRLIFEKLVREWNISRSNRGIKWRRRYFFTGLFKRHGNGLSPFIIKDKLSLTTGYIPTEYELFAVLISSSSAKPGKHFTYILTVLCLNTLDASWLPEIRLINGIFYKINPECAFLGLYGAL